jgi:hypothetical protein
MLIEKYFLKNNTQNTIIQTDLSFTLVHTNFGEPMKLFRHYAFSYLGTQHFFAEPSLRNAALECAIKRVHGNQEGLKLNVTHRLLVYADHVNIWGGSIHAIRKYTKALVIASKEISLEVNAEKTKHMVISRDKNPEQNSDINIGNKFFRTVKQFKYLGTTQANQISIRE